MHDTFDKRVGVTAFTATGEKSRPVSQDGEDNTNIGDMLSVLSSKVSKESIYKEM